MSYARAGETVRLELIPEIDIPNERSIFLTRDLQDILMTFSTREIESTYDSVGNTLSLLIKYACECSLPIAFIFACSTAKGSCLHLLQGRPTSPRTP